MNKNIIHRNWIRIVDFYSFWIQKLKLWHKLVLFFRKYLPFIFYLGIVYVTTKVLFPFILYLLIFYFITIYQMSYFYSPLKIYSDLVVPQFINVLNGIWILNIFFYQAFNVFSTLQIMLQWKSLCLHVTYYK